MILVGELSLWVALLMAAWATTVSFAGGLQPRGDLIRSGERALLATFAFVTLATVGLWSALFAHDFSLTYVASHTSLNVPRVYQFAALWAGQEGTLLCSALLLSAYSAVAVIANRQRDRAMMPWVNGTLAAVCLLLLGVICFVANPYQPLGLALPDGSGLHPQLQTAAMVLQPPLLALGLAAAVVPFALVFGGVLARRADGEWLDAVRRWMLWSWIFVSAGLLLGIWWAQMEPAWGGLWTWDVVENASLLPWLTSTVALHTLILHEKRGLYRRWTVVLVMLTLAFALLAMFLSRSAMVSAGPDASAATSSQSPVRSMLPSTMESTLAALLGFVALTVVCTVALLRARREELRPVVLLESAMSREGAMLFGNVGMMAMCWATLCGTLFPLVSGATAAQRSAIDAPLFNGVNGALGLVLLALLGIGPVLGWRRVSRDQLLRALRWPVALGVLVGVALLALGMRNVFALVAFALAGIAAGGIGQEIAVGVGARRRLFGESPLAACAQLLLQQRRRYGGYVAHAGIVVLSCALAAQLFARDITATVKTGDTISATDPYGRAWSFSSLGVSRFEELNRRVLAVSFTAVRDGKKMGVLSSESRQYIDSEGEPTYEPTTEVGLIRSQAQDVSLVFTGALDDESTVVSIRFNPLVWCLWLGGILLTLGGAIAMWPSAQREQRA